MYRTNKSKLVWGIVIGILTAGVIFCGAVAVGCAVNGVTFGQQITNWFGSNSETVAKIGQSVAETVTSNPLI